MDYEKALERARAAYGTGAYDDATLEFIFPQIKESEDERTRKELIVELQSWEGIPESKMRQYLAYLEKQKEQKPVEYLDKDKVYAIMTKLTNLSYSTRIPINSDEYKKLHEITSDVRGLLDYPIEQKPVNDKIIEDTISYLNGGMCFCNSMEELKYRSNLAYRLKSLRPSWKPSEEQMEALYKVAYNLVGTGTETDVYLVQLYEQLKKL